MGWLIHNPFGDMYGPAFLVFYLAVIALTYVSAYRSLKARDATRWMEPPAVPFDPDPYEVAYLRGGTNEVIRVGLLALIQRGYVEIFDDKPKRFSPKVSKIRKTADHPPEDRLEPFERAILQACPDSFAPADLFKSRGLSEQIEPFSEFYRKRAETEELLLPEAVKRAAFPTWLTGAAVLLGIAGYKVIAAVTNGRPNFMILVMLSITATTILALVVIVLTRRRLSDRGREYLDQLRLAFAELKTPVDSGESSAVPDVSNTLLMVSLFGLTSLKGTPQASYAALFPQAASSGCGGGGCGGGGGGGCGGGGCGGGGCGGCGG